MPSEIYEVIAQGARYWFLFLMALIVWRSFRWYRRDRRQAKKRRRLLPDAGYVGEMVVLEGGGALKRGDALAVPCEGTLGSLRSNDLCVPVAKVEKRHLWFRFDEDEGLRIEPYRGMTVIVDGEETGKTPVYMLHGSRLCVGEAVLRLRLFAGFESTARAVRTDGMAPQPEDGAPPAGENAESRQQMREWMLRQQWMMQQMAQQQAYQQMLQNQAYQQWLAQQENMRASSDEGEEDEVAPGETEDSWEDAQPADSPVEERSGVRQAAPEPPDFSDDWPYVPYPQSDTVQEDNGYTEADFYEPDELDEDMTDAAQPPKSAYIGHDEAEGAKRRVWDRYLGGGRRK